MTEKTQSAKIIRKPYRKPQLEKVQLVAEEAVLQGCKQPSQPGLGTSNCKTPGGGICSTLAS